MQFCGKLFTVICFLLYTEKFHIGQASVPITTPGVLTSSSSTTSTSTTTTPVTGKLAAMTYNTWWFAGHVDNGMEKLVQSISEVVNQAQLQQNTEWIIGLQEVGVLPTLDPTGQADLIVEVLVEVLFNDTPLTQFIQTLESSTVQAMQNLVQSLNAKTQKSWSYALMDIEKATELGIHGTLRPAFLYTENVQLAEIRVADGSRNIGGLFSWRDRSIAVWNLHLLSDSYSPSVFCQNPMVSASEIMQNEATARLPAVQTLFSDTKFTEWTSQYDSIVLGDFNVPSHIDWNPTRNYNRHLACGAKADFQFQFPIEMTNRGYVDVYRSTHPDVGLSPGVGYTFHTLYSNEEDYDYLTPEDRVDMIWFKTVRNELTLDTDDLPEVYDGLFWRKNDFNRVIHMNFQEITGPHRENEWPSDHRAVIAYFKAV